MALLGAESTGKSTLALALSERLRGCGWRVAAVAEYLREWCDTQGRTPLPHEQIALAHEQSRRVLTAQAEVVVADTTPLMTAVYSELLFGDRSLYPFAIEHQRCYGCTLLTGLDVPWVADPQRDGPHVRDRVDERVRRALDAAGLPYQVVYGLGPDRLEHAWRAIESLLLNATKSEANYSSAKRGEQQIDAMVSGLKPLDGGWHAVCDRCGDPGCERRSRRAPAPSRR